MPAAIRLWLRTAFCFMADTIKCWILSHIYSQHREWACWSYGSHCGNATCREREITEWIRNQLNTPDLPETSEPTSSCSSASGQQYRGMLEERIGPCLRCHWALGAWTLLLVVFNRAGCCLWGFCVPESSSEAHRARTSTCQVSLEGERDES